MNSDGGIAGDGDYDAEIVALRASIAPEVRSPGNWAGIGRMSFQVDGARQDIARARGLLAKDGMIRMADLAGHRGAVQLWRDHCQTRRGHTRTDLAEEITQLLYAPRPIPPLCGTREQPFYAWVRPRDIMVTAASNFPYHHTPDQLAEMAHNLIMENGEPPDLHQVFGSDLVVASTPTPRGPVYRVTEDGNHRAAVMRAAGFPVTLVRVTVQRGPWMLWPFVGTTEPLFRLMVRSGLITNLRRSNDRGYDYQILVDADGIALWLLEFKAGHYRDPWQARTNLLAYEATFGRVDDPRVQWIRDHDSFRRMLRLESMTITKHDSEMLPQLAGNWPPPQPTLSRRLKYRLLPQ